MRSEELSQSAFKLGEWLIQPSLNEISNSTGSLLLQCSQELDQRCTILKWKTQSKLVSFNGPGCYSRPKETGGNVIVTPFGYQKTTALDSQATATYRHVVEFPIARSCLYTKATSFLTTRSTPRLGQAVWAKSI